MQADYHIHTHNSGDSTAPMGDMIESALEKGLSEICFTEHMDMDFPVSEGVPVGTFELNTQKYLEEVLKYKEEYQNKINIKFGVELGLQPHLSSRIAEYVKEFPFDFVIGSIHLVDGQDPYYPVFWQGRTESEVIRRYFDYTLECINSIRDFDVLGHLDYIVRYTPTKGQGYCYDKYSDIIDEILKALISSGKGLDFNTQSLFRGGKNPNPNTDILGRYKELGGQIITFGSDAHTPEALAGCFEYAKELAVGCGFTEYYTFGKRIPSACML